MPVTPSGLTTRPQLVARRPMPQPLDAAPLVRAGITGSGDSLVLLTWTEEDLQRERAEGARVLRRAGIKAGMRVANTMPGALASPGSLLLGDVIEDCGALDVPLGTPDTDAAANAAWELVDRVETHVLILDPRTGERFLNAAPVAERPWLTGILWLRSDTIPVPQPPVPASLQFRGWQRAWLAAAEVASFIAASCADGFYHVDQNLGAEVIDGHLVVSRRQPEIRYATSFRAVRMRGCGCRGGGVVLEVA